MSQPAPITIFVSYSHKDETLRDELAKHLTLLERTKIIDAWHDRAILPGSEWDKAIKTELNEANIILLLISADFLASDYIWDVEVKTAMERHRAKDAVVIPIILRECAWFDAPFGELLALPKDGKAVTSYSNIDEQFTLIANHIKERAEGIRGQKNTDNHEDVPQPKAPKKENISATTPSSPPDDANRQQELEDLREHERGVLEKRKIFLKEQLIASDPDQKFLLKNRLEELEKQLADVREKIRKISR